SACVPCPTDTITITEAMPMITPSDVSALRIQLPRRANRAVRRTAVGCMGRESGVGGLVGRDSGTGTGDRGRGAGDRGCGVRGAGLGVRGSGFGVPSSECGVRDAVDGSGLDVVGRWPAGSGNGSNSPHDSGVSGSRVPGPRSRLLISGSRVPGPRSRLLIS